VLLKSSNCFCACGAQGALNLQEFEKFDPDPDSFVRGADRHRLCCVKGREGGKSRRSNARALYVAASMGDIFVFFFFFLGYLPSGKFPLVLIFKILFPNSVVSCQGKKIWIADEFSGVCDSTQWCFSSVYGDSFVTAMCSWMEESRHSIAYLSMACSNEQKRARQKTTACIGDVQPLLKASRLVPATKCW
jgi:hypothetical protein